VPVVLPRTQKTVEFLFYASEYAPAMLFPSLVAIGRVTVAIHGTPHVGMPSDNLSKVASMTTVKKLVAAGGLRGAIGD